MDKIIDGVDVSGCEQRSDTHNTLLADGTIKNFSNYCYITNDGCYGVNCYYKQLQRAKAEIEELKKQVKNNETAYHIELGTYNMECGNLLEENKNLIEENERLKEELRTEKIYSSQIEELEESLQHAKTENKELSESIKRLKNMAKAAALGREKYRQTLQEIRDIAREWLNNDWSCFHCRSNMDDKLQNILDKINEVIGELE